MTMTGIIKEQPVGFVPAIFIEEIPQGPVEIVSCQVGLEHDLKTVFLECSGHVFDIPHRTRQGVPAVGVIPVANHQGV
jgi:hypothetical protein